MMFKIILTTDSVVKSLTDEYSVRKCRAKLKNDVDIFVTDSVMKSLTEDTF